MNHGLPPPPGDDAAPGRSRSEGRREDEQQRAAGNRSVVSLDRLIRCGRVRLDGYPCRTPVARAGLPCRWHLFSDVAGPTGLGPWPAGVPDSHHCPVCGEQAVYHRPSDRFFHTDGSGNDGCWREILRGALWPESGVRRG